LSYSGNFFACLEQTQEPVLRALSGRDDEFPGFLLEHEPALNGHESFCSEDDADELTEDVRVNTSVPASGSLQ